MKLDYIYSKDRMRFTPEKLLTDAQMSIREAYSDVGDCLHRLSEVIEHSHSDAYNKNDLRKLNKIYRHLQEAIEDIKNI